MKSIILTPIQIKAKEAGATMFLFTIDNENISIDSINPDVFLLAYKFECSYCKGKYSQCTDCYGEGYRWDLDCESKEEFIAKYSPIKKGDKDIFIQEYAYQTDIGKMYYNVRSEVGSYYIPKENGTLIVASQMTKEQSRYSFSECIDVKVVRVQDITIKDISKLMWEEDWIVGAIEYLYNQQMKEQNINRTYKDNDYVFLVEFA